ncbi:MAG: hypothetical protein HYU99_02125 [Deltaproteobacteria bacterium]|nr:hypothetical protein [Deltaproteobacteria bacterium]
MFCVLISGLFPLRSAQALPSWARRYNADCSMCHTMMPQLNPIGHQFRRLGYRMPEEFDNKEVQFSWDDLAKFTNYFAARGRARATVNKQSPAKIDFDFEQHDVTLFYGGPVTRNIAYFFEMPFEPENEFAELEVGQIQLAFGHSDSFFFTRMGQFHQFSRVGYGGLDRPIGLNNARMFDVRVNGFRPRHDGLGVEAGWSNGNFTGLLQFTSGIEATGGSVLDNEDPNNDKDMALLLEYLIPNHNASVSLLYVYGRAPTPQNDAGADVAGAGPTRYHRFYLFGDYTFEKIGLKPIIGFSLGIDNQTISGIGTATAALISADNSLSWFSFLELDKSITDNLYLLGRFDYDDVTNKAEGAANTSKTWAGTAGLVWQFQRYMRFSVEYKVADSQGQHPAHAFTTEAQLVF